jgi:hypothetical protein
LKVQAQHKAEDRNLLVLQALQLCANSLFLLLFVKFPLGCLKGLHSPAGSTPAVMPPSCLLGAKLAAGAKKARLWLVQGYHAD